MTLTSLSGTYTRTPAVRREAEDLLGCVTNRGATGDGASAYVYLVDACFRHCRPVELQGHTEVARQVLTDPTLELLRPTALRFLQTARHTAGADQALCQRVLDAEAPRGRAHIMPHRLVRCGVPEENELFAMLQDRLPDKPLVMPRIVVAERAVWEQNVHRDWFAVAFGRSNIPNPHFAHTPALAWQIVAAPLVLLGRLAERLGAVLGLLRRAERASAFDQVRYLPSTGEVYVEKDADGKFDYLPAVTMAMATGCLHQAYPKSFIDTAKLLERGHSRWSDPGTARASNIAAARHMHWINSLSYGLGDMREWARATDYTDIARRIGATESWVALSFDIARDPSYLEALMTSGTLGTR